MCSIHFDVWKSHNLCAWRTWSWISSGLENVKRLLQPWQTKRQTDLSPPAFCSVLVKLGTGRTLWPDHSTQAQRAAPLRECPPPVWTREGRCRVRSWRRRVASGRTASSLTSPSPASSTSWIPPPCWSETSQTQETVEGCRLELLSRIIKSPIKVKCPSWDLCWTYISEALKKSNILTQDQNKYIDFTWDIPRLTMWT